MLVLVLLYDETCMPKIKYIKYRVVHVYTLGNYDNYYIIILDYENLAFHFLKSFHLCEFSFFHRYDISGKVDISDLTWEQKERVIRYLFARMNGGAKVTKMNSGPPLPAIENKVQRLSITHEPRYAYSSTTSTSTCFCDGVYNTILLPRSSKSKSNCIPCNLEKIHA